MWNSQIKLLSFLIIFTLFSIVITTEKSLALPYYEGKRITIIVSGGPGGGNDRMARLLQKFLPKYIPGKPTVIVQNMPGAGGVLVANYLYGIAKPDGLTIGSPQRGFPFAQLLKVEGVKFDARKYSWIGSTAIESTVLAIRSELPYKTFADLQKANKPLMIGGTAPTESSTQFIFFLQEFLRLNAKMVYYPGSADAMLAVERRELDGRAGSFSSLKKFVERGTVKLLIRSRTSEEEIKDLPVDEELAADKKGKLFMAMRASIETIGKPYIAPPKTPPEVINILREAFEKMSNDPELLKFSKNNDMDYTYISAEECQKVMNKLLGQPMDITNEFAKYVKF